MSKVRTSFWIDSKLKDRVISEAKKSNMSMGEYINIQLSKKSIVVIESGKDIAYELRKIGNNLNQVAKKLNIDNSTFYDTEIIEEIDRGITKIWQLLNSLK